MKKLLSIGVACLLLTSCVTSDPNAAAETVLSGYVAAATAEAAYEALPSTNASSKATVKLCDNTAYTLISPLNAAVQAGTSQAGAVLTNAQSGLVLFQSCLTSAGVKLS